MNEMNECNGSTVGSFGIGSFVSKRRHRTAILPCVKSQKNADLLYVAREARNRVAESN